MLGMLLSMRFEFLKRRQVFMSLWRVLSLGPSKSYYKDAHAFYFALNCFIVLITCAVFAFALMTLRSAAAIARMRSKLPVVPIQSRKITWILGCMYLGLLVYISPFMAFLFIGSMNEVPLIILCAAAHGVILLFCFLLPSRSEIPFVLTQMALVEFAVCAAHLIQTVTMFDYVSPASVGAIGLLSSIPFWVVLAYIFAKHIQEDRRDSFTTTITEVPGNALFWFLGFAATVLSVVLTVVFAGACIAPFGETLPHKINFSESMVFSTRFIRSFADPYCTEGVCHVYLTAGPDLTSSVFVNVHLPLRSAEHLDLTVDGGNAMRMTQFLNPWLDEADQRQIFSVFVSNLTAGVHAFSLSTNLGKIGDEEYLFKLPNQESIKFAIGGDAGVTLTSDLIVREMYKTDPHVIIIGGDVAYDNGFYACACMWDYFLEILLRYKAEDQYLVPLSFAVGNHDIGYNHDNQGAWAHRAVHDCDAPPFFAWFPHEVDKNQIPIPACHRSANRVHSVGNLTNVWILDSAYTVYPDEVVSFVDKEIQKVGKGWNLGIYHVPLYSVHVHDYAGGESLRKRWPLRLFDKYRFVANFENHSHLYKRTKLLADGQVADRGTVYLGDGNMGVTEDRIAAATVLNHEDVRFETARVDFHFFDVDVSVTRGVSIKAIDPRGRIFDSVKLRDYGVLDI